VTARLLLAAATAGALAVAVGCGGGEAGAPPATTAGAAAQAITAPAPAAPVNDGVAVRVVDGDTDAPVAGALVRGGGPGLDERATSGSDGTARLAGDVRLVRASAPGYGQARAAARGPRVTVRLYDPKLQSPEYGGTPQRRRYLPAVRLGVPRGAPDWVFESRTLLEFPPVVDRGLLVVGANSGRVHALDARTGEHLWARRQRGEIASSPALSGDLVYVTSMDGALTAYRRADGRQTWQFTTGGSPIESSPLVVDGLVYVGAHNGQLYALDADSGALRWTYSAGGDIKSSAALAGDAVVVGDYAGQVHAVDRRSGSGIWRYSGGQRFYGGAGVSGDTVVIGDIGGTVLALDRRSGAVRWSHGTGGSFVYASPAIAGDDVYIGSYNGQFQALDLATGAVRWSHDAGGRISGSATVVDDVVYATVLTRPGEPKRTFGLDAASGAVRYRGNDGRYSPAVGAGRNLYLVGTRTIYAFREPGT